MSQDHLSEEERRQNTAEWLHVEKEHYEYMLRCAEVAEDEEWAFETVVFQATAADFVAAAREVNALRAEKALKPQPLPADTSTTSTEDASAGAQTRRQP